MVLIAYSDKHYAMRRGYKTKNEEKRKTEHYDNQTDYKTFSFFHFIRLINRKDNDISKNG